MDTFNNRIAVVTGGGSGIGRELVVQLASAGCHVAFCDVRDDSLQGTLALCELPMARGVRVTAHRCDVACETELEALASEVLDQHATTHINLLFNNAGISGGGSFVRDPRDQWERTFGICWGGVYLGCRVFLPLLQAADAAHIINTSSVNGFWASLGPYTEHTAYSAAKFAVKGFSEALVVDLRHNAPHIGVSVVMPGHIGTSIALNTSRTWAGEPETMAAEDVARVRERWQRADPNVGALSDDEVRALVRAGTEAFRDDAPTTASEAASIILAGVLDGRWRILVGDDAVALDQAVRAAPERAYDPDFNGLGIENALQQTEQPREHSA